MSQRNNRGNIWLSIPSVTVQVNSLQLLKLLHCCIAHATVQQSLFERTRFSIQFGGLLVYINLYQSRALGFHLYGPFVPIKTISETTLTIPKTRKEYNDVDRKAIEKNFQVKKILVYGIGPDEYNRILTCQSAKEIWEALQATHEGTTQVKQSKIDMLTTVCELFKIKDDESIQDMHTRVTSIIHELNYLGEIIPRNKLARKILSMLPGSWESKDNDIREAKDMQKLMNDKLIENLKTYEMKKKKDHERKEPKKKKNMVLKVENSDSSGDDADMAYLRQRFQKMGFSSSESEGDNEQGDTSMMFVESEAAEYNSIFALMEKYDNDEDDDDDGVNFLDVQRNLKSYSQKKLLSLSNVLIDAYHSLINDKKNLTKELGEVEHERDDLLVIVIDLKEIIGDLKNEKDILTEKIKNIEHETHDLLVVVVDLEKIVEKLRRENISVKALIENCMNSSKGKEVASEARLKLENELKKIKLSMYAEPGANRQLQEDLRRV
ncbi:uncharacterized protein [Nicotiana sylvestris]|uniref:uncharacterized protein n=1 Tax=Nicotiana sylvestris TaxID=4096 RepID=UPI00388C64B4